MYQILLWLTVAMQAPGGPALPVALAKDEAVVAAWEQTLSAESPEDRRAHAATVLAALPKVREAAQLDFLLACEHERALADATLRPEYLRLRDNWRGFSSAMAARISGDGVAEEVRAGAVRAARQIPLSAEPVMLALGSRLASIHDGAEVRAALRIITGRDFASERVFLDWWETAQGKSRERWLQESLSSAHELLVEDWRARLAADSAAAVEAVEHPVGEIRALGYESLRRREADPERPSDSAEAQAIISRMQAEEVYEYRMMIIRLVTRFLQGQAAVSQLSVAIDRGRGKEKELAVSQLQNVEPASVAIEAFRAQLALAYPSGKMEPRGSSEYRIALWSGLASLVRQEQPEEEVLTDKTLTAYLRVEKDAVVKDYYYEAAGEIGSGEEFITAIELYLGVNECTVRERVRALRAMTRIAERTGEFGSLRESLPLLLADEERAIRRQAIRSLGELPMEEGPSLLIERLPLEHTSGLQADVLAALRELAATETLAPLLDFKPVEEFENSYGQTLAAVVGEDWGRLTRALDALVEQKRFGQARNLIKLFPTRTLTDPQIDTLARREARVLAHYLLRVGIDGQSPSTVTDAVHRLSDQHSATPEDPEWPLLYVRLQLVRGEVTDAIVWLESRVLPAKDVPELVKWELALDCLSSARAKEQLDAGRGLIELLGEPPAEYKFRAEQEFAFFREPEVVEEPPTEEETATEEGGSEQEEGETPPPAEPQGSGAEPGSEPASDPGSEPVAGGGSDDAYAVL